MNRAAIVLFMLLIQTNEVIAGPGGKIAKELFESPAGKIIGLFLIVILFPLILRYRYVQNKYIRSTQRKLAQLSRIEFESFDEINLKNRMTDIFSRVHKGWSERDLDTCEEYMTNWYRQNQQSVYLDEWDSKGLMNICTIQKVNDIKPLHLRVTENPDFEGTRIMFAIDANMEDYLVNIEDSSVLEGKKGFKDVETVWTLKLVDRVWKVDNIEQADMIPNYMKMESTLSDSLIEKWIESKNKAEQHSAQKVL